MPGSDGQGAGLARQRGVLRDGAVQTRMMALPPGSTPAARRPIATDPVPANATYIANTVTLNGLPVGQPDGGVSPLIAGIDVSSSDLPPPLPGAGTITVGETATVTFDVLLDPAITSGTVISRRSRGRTYSASPASY